MHIENLNTTKNLLAFSGGVDSTALFFILKKNNIPFDIAIVDYKQRVQAKQEIEYAKQLSKEYNKKIFITDYTLSSFSEKKARDFRYNFFDRIMSTHSYQTLIMGHQLNDNLEWFIMQLIKGAGFIELIGLQVFSKRNKYTIFRPLLNYSKDELTEYLLANNIKHFIDKTNNDFHYKRNAIRHTYTNTLLKQHKEGIQKSFKYMQKDIDTFNKLYKIHNIEQLAIVHCFLNDWNVKIRIIDLELKKRGFIISSSTRELIQQQKSCVISHKVVVCVEDNLIFVAPYCKISLNKKFKEWCRINKIPKLIRPYFSMINNNPKV